MPEIAEVSLAYRSKKPVDALPQITNPQDAAQYLRSIWNPDTLELREEFIVVLLNNAKKVIGWSRISTGGSNATIVEPATVFQTAMLGKADSIIVAHNHPSGRLQASTADIQLTKRLGEIGTLMGIPLDDHIILTAMSYLSLREEKQF